MLKNEYSSIINTILPQQGLHPDLPFIPDLSPAKRNSLHHSSLDGKNWRQKIRQDGPGIPAILGVEGLPGAGAEGQIPRAGLSGF
jgi:hypothetical protein